MLKAKKLSKIEDNIVNLNSPIQQCKQVLPHQKKIHKLPKNRKKHTLPAGDLLTQSKKTQLNMKSKIEEDFSNSTMNMQQQKSEKYSNPDFQPQKNILLQNNLKFPKYILFSNSNIVNGSIGHGTLFFKKPIVEGFYYFEVKILSNSASNFPVKNPSSIRIGLCSSSHNLDVPLGFDNSVCYSSSKGSVVYNSLTKMAGEICKQGDIVGCSVEIAPPHKHRIDTQINPNNKVIFYKNGQPICKPFCQLQNTFYHFGISLYNFARVQIFQKQNQMTFKPSNYEPISNIRSQQIYKDLKFVENP